jgi:fluoride ion exporter CrcB/FEX
MVGGYLVVFVGGGLGAALRHAVNRASLAYLGPDFPYGTMFVNVVGGLIMMWQSGVSPVPHHRIFGWLHDLFRVQP